MDGFEQCSICGILLWEIKSIFCLHCAVSATENGLDWKTVFNSNYAQNSFMAAEKYVWPLIFSIQPSFAGVAKSYFLAVNVML